MQGGNNSVDINATTVIFGTRMQGTGVHNIYFGTQLNMRNTKKMVLFVGGGQTHTGTQK